MNPIFDSGDAAERPARAGLDDVCLAPDSDGYHHQTRGENPRSVMTIGLETGPRTSHRSCSIASVAPPRHHDLHKIFIGHRPPQNAA